MSDVAVVEPPSGAVESAAATQSSKTDAASAATPSSMHIKVYSPFKVYFDQDAVSISAVNATGPFDILSHHHNFITLLEPCELVIREHTQREQRIRISSGLMHVKADRVTVFLDI